MNNARIKSLDTFRGIALIFIIFFHTSIYGFSNIHKIDFSNPPLVVVLMSFMTLWGGIFILYSAFINAYKTTLRSENTSIEKPFKHLLTASLIYLGLHILLSYIFGRWANDFENNMPNMTLIPASIRSGTLVLPKVEKLFEGTSLSTIALNLLICSFILKGLFSKGTKELTKKLYILTVVAFAILIFSYLRIDLYRIFDPHTNPTNLFGGLIFSFFLANPYPLLPYISYGILGLVMGISYAKQENSLKYFLISGFALLIIGFLGMSKHDKTISTPDYFWYFKTYFELGLFILMLVFSLFLNKIKSLNFKVIQNFSRISLSIYMLETTLSEILRIPATRLFPSWHTTINGALMFGLFNVILWAFIVNIWAKYNFKYSLEYYWIKFFAAVDKKSTKFD